MRACLASGGYAGCTFLISNPCDTPSDTRTRCGVATLGTATGVELIIPPITPPIWPPGIPPGTPPTTPAPAISGGGASSSLIIWTFCGILVGVRSWPFTRSLWICLTTLTGVAAGGGGGGGGGGGATRKVMSCCFGSASVKISGNSTSTPTSSACTMNEIVVVAPRFVFSRPPDSIRLSSNIGFSLQPTLRKLRHHTSALCSQATPLNATRLPPAPGQLQSLNDLLKSTTYSQRSCCPSVAQVLSGLQLFERPGTMSFRFSPRGGRLHLNVGFRLGALARIYRH